MPAALKEIEDEAFMGCAMLGSIDLPVSLTDIGSSAFAKCPSLREVYVKSPNPPSISGNTFKGASCTFWIPNGSKKLYKADKKWTKLSNIKEM